MICKFLVSRMKLIHSYGLKVISLRSNKDGGSERIGSHPDQTLDVRTCCISSIDRQSGERHRPQAELIVGETTGWRRQDTRILGRIQRWHWDGADHS